MVRDAVEVMVHEPAYDPDYRSLWPRATRVLGARVDGDLATVDLSAEALGSSAGSAVELASLQQLVWTVTAAAPAVQRVRVLVEGRSSGMVAGREVAGAVVHRGFAAGVGAPARGPWSDSVTLVPGRYLLRAYESSAKDGSVTFLDTKAFTVR